MARFILHLTPVVFALLLSGCADDTCRKMQQCCDASKELSGVGEACEKLTKGPNDPKTCLSVLETLAFMHEDQKAPLPDVCRTP